MGDYKVIYRDANPAWQEGCPIRLDAIQISRNRQNGDCFLQTRLTNISNQIVQTIEIVVKILGHENASEQAVIKLLDADLPAGESLVPDARRIELTEVKDVSASVIRVDEQCSFDKAIVVPAQALLGFSDERLMAERDRLLIESGAASGLCTGRHQDHGDWWQCSCGAINLHRAVCWYCNVPLEVLEIASSEDYLSESRSEYLYSIAVDKLESDSQQCLSDALEIFNSLAENDYRDSREKANEARCKLENSEKNRERRRKRLIKASVALAILVVTIALIFNFAIIPMREEQAQNEHTYASAVKKYEEEDYKGALKLFESLDDFKDSKTQAKSASEKLNQQQEEVYQRATSFLSAGDYMAAYRLFSSIEDYSDSNSKAEEAKHLSDLHPFAREVGFSASFGRTQWRILAKTDTSALVISAHAIGGQVYNADKSKGTAYATSDLRGYLNGEFKTSMFTEEERALIQGEIMIFDYDQVQKYMPSDEDRVCDDHWVIASDANGFTEESGKNREYLMVVNSDGSIPSCSTGTSVDHPVNIRPAMWVEL